MDDPVAQVLSEAMPSPDGSPRIITAWVAVATFADADGGNQIACISSERMPTWTARGLLLEAMMFGRD